MGEIFEELADRVAAARTRALMGERQEALALLQRARIDFLRFREVLRGYPGSLALEYSIDVAQAALCEERARAREVASGETESASAGDASLAA